MIINLNPYRKKRRRSEAEAQATENRVRFGRSNDQRTQQQRKRERQKKQLEDKRLEESRFRSVWRGVIARRALHAQAISTRKAFGPPRLLRSFPMSLQAVMV
jgi:hypothetical protein